MAEGCPDGDRIAWLGRNECPAGLQIVPKTRVRGGGGRFAAVFPQPASLRDLAEIWEFTGIPRAVLIGADGKLVWRGSIEDFDENLLTEQLKQVRSFPRFVPPSTDDRVAALERLASAGGVCEAAARLADLTSSAAKDSSDVINRWKKIQDDRIRRAREVEDPFQAYRLATWMAGLYQADSTVAMKYEELVNELPHHPAYAVGSAVYELQALRLRSRTEFLTQAKRFLASNPEAYAYLYKDIAAEERIRAMIDESGQEWTDECRKLDQVVSLDFIEKPLADVVEYLNQATGLRIICPSIGHKTTIRAKALEAGKALEYLARISDLLYVHGSSIELMGRDKIAQHVIAPRLVNPPFLSRSECKQYANILRHMLDVKADLSEEITFGNGYMKVALAQGYRHKQFDDLSARLLTGTTTPLPHVDEQLDNPRSLEVHGSIIDVAQTVQLACGIDVELSKGVLLDHMTTECAISAGNLREFLSDMNRKTGLIWQPISEKSLLIRRPDEPESPCSIIYQMDDAMRKRVEKWMDHWHGSINGQQVVIPWKGLLLVKGDTAFLDSLSSIVAQ